MKRLLEQVFGALCAALRSFVRVYLGAKFIQCRGPNDILVVRRYGGPREWEYTFEQLVDIVVCGKPGHVHRVVFADAQFWIDAGELEANARTADYVQKEAA